MASKLVRMTIEYRIDHERRIVLAMGHGTFTDQEVFAYQQEVWSNPEVAGYDELIDMSDVQQVAVPSPDRARQLARLAAHMDAPATASKFAIVAPGDLAFGLGRMCEAYRSLDSRSTKQVRVFRSMADACAWLGTKAAATKSIGLFGGGLGR